MIRFGPNRIVSDRTNDTSPITILARKAAIRLNSRVERDGHGLAEATKPKAPKFTRPDGPCGLASGWRVEGIPGQPQASSRRSDCRLDEEHPPVLDQSDPRR